MFEHIQARTSRPILGSEWTAYKKDPNPINQLGVGVFKMTRQYTHLKAVKQAEERFVG